MKKLLVVAIALIAFMNCFSQSEYGTSAEWNQYYKKNPTKQDYVKLFQRMEFLEKSLLNLNTTMTNFSKSYQDKIDSLYQNNFRLLSQINNLALNMKIYESQSITQNTVQSSFSEAANYQEQPRASYKPQSSSTTYKSSSVGTTKPTVSYGRCKATTKKGTQCSRSGGSSGYCWQHG